MSTTVEVRGRVAVIACGALALHVKKLARERGWGLDVHPLPAHLHNRPERIAPEVERLAVELEARYDRVVVAYADCGTGGALDGYTRLPGDTCYDLFARDEVREALAEEPGTYFLTDFLVRSFERSVVRPLGLDRYPELRDAYFGNYRRVLWLAQDESLRERAEAAARRIGLPLDIRVVGEGGLERALEEVVGC